MSFQKFFFVFVLSFITVKRVSHSLQLNQQDLANCGISKYCAFFPPKCETLITATRDSNCTGAFTIETLPNGIYFTFLGTTVDIGNGATPTFVGLGFSLDQFMGDDTVIACVINGSIGRVYAAWNDKTRGYLQRDATPKMISNTSTLFVNGDMRCSGFWSYLPTSPMQEPSHIYDLSKYNFHFLFVRGFSDRYSGELAGHSTIDSTAFPWITSTPVQFCTSQSPSCNTSAMAQSLAAASGNSHQSAIPRLVKHSIGVLHAIFMMTAWWCIAGPSILIARYLKCPKTSCWFQLHRVFMILVFLLVTAAFFGILYQAEWKVFTCSFVCDHEAFAKQVHTIAGFCVYILLCFQVLCGIFRPGKTSSIRHYFNWIHTMSGFTAWIGASTCCVLGIQLGKTGFTYGGFKQFPEHIMMIIISSFIICAIICEFSSRRNRYKPEVDDKVRSIEESQEGFNCCSLFFVLVYVCISIAGVILLSLMLISIFFQRGFKF